MRNDKLKILSASAIALIALTGTAYGVDRVDLPNTESDVSEVQQKDATNQAKDKESSTKESEEEKDSSSEGSKEVVNDSSKEESGEGNKESAESDKQESDKQESDKQESDKQESDKEESSDSSVTDSSKEEEEKPEEDSDKEETEDVVEEDVDEKVVVPSKDLPYDKETGLLDFAEYHKLANGRALPRELTDKEKAYFAEYVEDGKYDEVRNSVTDVDYKLVKIYPEDYYISKDAVDLKWDKYTLVYSELLPLDQQREYLAERKAEEQDLISQGFVYNKDTGEFVLGLTDSDDVLHGVEDATDIDGAVTDDPVENEDAVQDIHYEEKELYENLSDYDGLSDAKFVKEYGANFLFRGEVPASGFTQREYKLNNGLTLAVEIESVQDEGEDNIFLTWGVVREPIKYENNTNGLKIAGKYNFATNESSDTYIKDNVLEVGTAQLREDGKYTPSKVYVEYTGDDGVPHAYLLVADAVLVGEDQKRLSELVGYIEFGWEDIYDDGFENGTEEPDKGESDNGNNGSGNGSGNNNGSNNGSGNNDGSNNGSDNTNDNGNTTDHDKLPDWVKPIDTNKDVIISKEEAEKAGYDTDLTLQKDHPLYDYMDKGEDKDSSNTVNDKDESNESFKQTGTAVVWGAIFTGLGLGAIGTYIKKRGRKEQNEEDNDTDTK